MKKTTLSLLVVIAVLTGFVGSAYSNSAFTSASGISGCSTCHNGAPALNAYGQLLQNALAIRGSEAAAYACVGAPPGQACVATPPTCTSFTYDAWGACDATGTQIRNVISSSPTGCTGGTPVTSQSCTPTCTSFTYGAWGACVNGSQTRTATGLPSGCTGTADPATLTQSCSTTPPPTTGTMPMPVRKKVFYSAPVEDPVLSSDPAKAKPIGVGPVAHGGDTLEIRLAVGAFAAPVDLSFGIYSLDIDPVDVFFLDSRHNFNRISRNLIEAALELNAVRPSDSRNDDEEEAVKNEVQKRMVWKASATSLNESPFGAIPVSNLPEGIYILMLKASPAGKQTPYYLWATSFSVD